MNHENPPPNRFNWPVAFTIVVLFLGGTSAFFLYRFFDGFRPKSIINEKIVNTTAISELKRRAKLAVLSAKVASRTEVTNDKLIGAFGFSFPVGTTRVTLQALQNRVQFVVPLELINTNKIRFNQDSHELTVVLPHPIVDDELVEIDQFPEVRTEVGWFRFDSRSGEVARNTARQQLRDSVIREARGEVYQAASRDAARDAALKLLEPAIAHLPGYIHIRIEFEDPPKLPKG